MADHTSDDEVGYHECLICRKHRNGHRCDTRHWYNYYVIQDFRDEAEMAQTEGPEDVCKTMTQRRKKGRTSLKVLRSSSQHSRELRCRLSNQQVEFYRF